MTSTEPPSLQPPDSRSSYFLVIVDNSSLLYVVYYHYRNTEFLHALELFAEPDPCHQDATIVSALSPCRVIHLDASI
jgi:hypothetical protein